MEDINVLFQNSKSCFRQIKNVADFPRQSRFLLQRIVVFIYSFLTHISIGMAFFSLVQLSLDSFPNWNGNIEISVPFARLSYASPISNRVVFLTFFNILKKKK